MGSNDRRDVFFEINISEYGNCFCSACHDTSRVTRITFPLTKYFDGKNLSTKYDEYWLCAKCRSKLADALNCPKEE